MSNACRLFLRWLVRHAQRRIQVLRERQRRGLAASSSDAKDPVSPAFEEFLSANQPVWERMDGAKPPPSRDRFILIEGLSDHPGYSLINLVTGRHAMQVYGLAGAALLEEPNGKLESLFRSYGIERFHYLSDRKRNTFGRLACALRAAALIRRMRSMDDLIRLEYDGIHVGKIGYDNFLRSTGRGTVSHINFRIFEALMECLSYQEYLERLFSSGAFPVVIQAERQFIPSGLVFQVALKYGAVFYVRGGGPSRFTLRLFQDAKEVYFDTYRPSRELFDYVWKNFRSQAVRGGAEYLEKRFRGEPLSGDIPGAAEAYEKTKRVISKQELSQMFGWDPQRPIVGVMVNMLTDGVFTNNWKLFKDHLTWLRNVLRFARLHKEANWLIKPHPGDVRNRVRTTASSEHEKWAGDAAHVHVLPDDVNSRSLHEILSVVLTVHGNAGLEHACYGIPCILAGESMYSGFGFTLEPRTVQEFFAQLEQIHTLKPLTSPEIERARVLAYIYLVLFRVESTLIPEFGIYNGNFDEAKLWRDSSKLVRSYRPGHDRQAQMLEIQFRNKHRHLLNYDWVGMA